MTRRATHTFVTLALAASSLFLSQSSVSGQTPPKPTPPPPPADPLLRVSLPPVTVNAQKEPAEIQTLPVSVTAVSAETIEEAGLRTVSDGALFAPNTIFTEFTARKLSNARFRGIGSSPGNPAITTYLDGVPQLNSNSSNIDLLDVTQLEFVRGPQSALFGRNALGGVVNVATRRPGNGKWTGNASMPFGNYSSFELRGTASGALIADTLSAGGAFNVISRDGFTVNSVTGDDLDSRSSFSGKGQLLWKPAQQWEARVIVSGERARDGDYALNDLASLRATPFTAARDVEGFTHRNIFNTTILTERKGSDFTISTTTGFVRWTTQDSTDLDYSPVPLATRDNDEQDFQFTQEVRVASTKPTALPGNASLRWQAGAFLFTQNYEQDAVNHLAPLVIAPIAVNQYSPVAELDDVGFGLFGQGTLALNDKLDVIAGARFDYESKNADLKSFLDPALAPPTVVNADDSFSNVSPQISVSYRLQPQRMVYATLARGFKAGGFNPASPAGSESYGEEQTWNVEGGIKTRWWNDRVAFNAAAFFIDWNNLQLNVPNLAVPAQLYIANVGNAASAGFELETVAKAAPGVDVFGTFGLTEAHFGDGSTALGADISDNEVPFTPDVTASMGVQYGRAITPTYTVYGRADLVIYGAFKYDESNAQGQDAYSLTNLRGGVRTKRFFGEAWMRNAFNTAYIPIALSFPFAPSGYIGENGAPRTFGVNVGITF
jgi:iron complex outermembrane recepter protein